jgi:hypothetical protein
MSQDVYRATDFDILPLSPSASVSRPAHPVEAHLLALVRSHLKNGHFLFSYTYDLTRRMQAQWQALKKDQGKAMWEVVGIQLLVFGSCILTGLLLFLPYRQTIGSFGTGSYDFAEHDVTVVY